MRQVGNKISYVRNPFARQSFFCLALGLGTFSIYLSLKGAGQGGLNTGAYGFSSIVAAAAGLWYGILSFTEDNCNYILAKIGIALEGILIIIWAVILIIGFTGR